MSRRRLLSTLVGLGISFCASGCGGGSHPLSTVRTAVQSTITQSVDSTVTLRDVTLFGSAPGHALGRAVFAFPKGFGEEAVDFSHVLRETNATTYFVFTPGEVLVEPISSTTLPKGKIWIAATLTGPTAPDARDARLAEVLEALNPQLLLDEILWGGVAASSRGVRVLVHVPSTEYDVTVDLRAALARASGAAGALRAAISDELAAGPASVRVAVWIDGSGRIVQLSASPPGSGLGSLLFGLTAFGTSVPTSIPSAAQSLDLHVLRPRGLTSAAWVFTGGGST